LANLSCGCLALLLVLGNGDNLHYAGLLVIMGAIFDFFDGFAARLLKISSPVGKELDSLADVVTFGLVPAFIARDLFLHTDVATQYPMLSYFPLIIALFSALRLAKFNVDDRQTNGFIGVPTPANSLFWISLPLVAYFEQVPHPFWINSLLENGWLILIMTMITSLLLISEISLIALKFNGFGWVGNEPKYVLIIASTLLFSIFQFSAMPLVLMLYILISLFFNRQKKRLTMGSWG